MKKKSSDAKLNSVCDSSGSSGGIVDRKLVQRVEQASGALSVIVESLKSTGTCTVILISDFRLREPVL